VPELREAPRGLLAVRPRLHRPAQGQDDGSGERPLPQQEGMITMFGRNRINPATGRPHSDDKAAGADRAGQRRAKTENAIFAGAAARGVILSGEQVRAIAAGGRR
jgi:hypothetical protein